MKNRSLVAFGAVAVCILTACGNGTEGVNTAPTPTAEISPSPLRGRSESPAVSLKPDSERLITVIKQLQREYVRDSIGVQAHECFTEDDFNQFNSSKKTVEIVERLRKDNDFRALLNSIRDLNSEKRSDLLDRAAKTYREAWEQLKLNPTTASADELRKGQTLHGMKAERLIAQTVVDLVRQMLSSGDI